MVIPPLAVLGVVRRPISYGAVSFPRGPPACIVIRPDGSRYLARAVPDLVGGSRVNESGRSPRTKGFLSCLVQAPAEDCHRKAVENEGDADQDRQRCQSDVRIGDDHDPRNQLDGARERIPSAMIVLIERGREPDPADGDQPESDQERDRLDTADRVANQEAKRLLRFAWKAERFTTAPRHRLE